MAVEFQRYAVYRKGQMAHHCFDVREAMKAAKKLANETGETVQVIREDVRAFTVSTVAPQKD